MSTERKSYTVLKDQEKEKSQLLWWNRNERRRYPEVFPAQKKGGGAVTQGQSGDTQRKEKNRKNQQEKKANKHTLQIGQIQDTHTRTRACKLYTRQTHMSKISWSR